MHEVFLCLKSCLFEKAKLIKHAYSLSGAGRLVFLKKNTTWI